MSETPHTYGIIGDPLTHSLSPRLFSALFRHQRLSAVYLPLPISTAQLAAVPQCMRLLDIAGLNVTAPHKVAILPHLDVVDPEAVRIGAVNTIVRRRGRTIGYNTDARGFLAALRHTLGLHPRGLRVALVGTGGAARAIGDALCRHGVRTLCVYARMPARARALVRHWRGHLATRPCLQNPHRLPPRPLELNNSGWPADCSRHASPHSVDKMRHRSRTDVSEQRGMSGQSGGQDPLSLFQARRQPMGILQTGPSAVLRAVPLTPTTWREALLTHDLIIQASAAPLMGRGALRWPSRCRPTACALFDLRYGPRNPLVVAARAHGCRATDGLEMLLQQAALSFRLWTRQIADLEYWRGVARRALPGC